MGDLLQWPACVPAAPMQEALEVQPVEGSSSDVLLRRTHAIPEDDKSLSSAYSGKGNFIQRKPVLSGFKVNQQFIRSRFTGA